MNDFLEKTYYHNTVLEWGKAAAIILGALLLAKALYWFFNITVKKLTSKTESRLDDILVDKVEEPVVFAVAIYGVWLGLNSLHFPDDQAVHNWIERGYYILIVFNITWLFARLVDAIIEEYLVPFVESSEGSLDDQLLPILRKGIRFTIWCVGIIVGLDNAGYDVTTILAGLGIGGLAFALAAQDTVKNFIGGVTIFIDKPFKLNQRVQVAGFDGTVREIGIRSTRIETLDGRIVTIPNAEIANKGICNVTSEPNRKVVNTIGLTYDTTHEQMVVAMDVLKSMPTLVEGIEEKVIVNFAEFGSYSMNITFIFYIKSDTDIPTVQSAVNLKTLEKFNALGLDFAFPTQTIYTKNR